MARAHHVNHWEEFEAPSLSDIEMMALAAFERLPAIFRDMAGHIHIRVDDFPDQETLDSMGLESPYDLLGLFQGIGLSHAGGMPETGQLPNMIWLYRRPILDYWAEHDETLGHLVTHVLIHEIGHHFGLSDDEMAAVETSVHR